MKRMLFYSMISLGMTISFPVAAQVSNTLCSNVACVVGTRGVNCVLPGVSLSVPVTFTVTDSSSYPLLDGPMNVVSSQVITQTGGGICSYPSNLLPYGTSSVSLDGSGSDYNQYQQVWSGQVCSWGVTPLPPGVTYTYCVSTQSLSFQASGCATCSPNSGTSCGTCGTYTCSGACADSCSNDDCDSPADCAPGDTCDDGTCVGSCTPNEGNSCGGCGTIQCDDTCNDPCDGESSGSGGGSCDSYQNAFGSWICNGTYCSNGCDGTGCDCAPTDPIMIDLTGSGYQLTDVTHGVKFDFAGKGNSTLTSWTAANWNGGFLALDRNGNGKIDNGTELFGNLTPQPTPAKGKVANGFLALAVYDEPANGGNGDGWIDEHDAIYSKLVIWVDKNHNGISEPGELLTLKEAGVQAISLNDSASQWKDAFGNLFRYRSQIRDNAPGTQFVYDVLLEQAVPNKAAMTVLTKQ